ncbi:uncharacterized protein GGS25DRAFT_288479 [Hypoxylon fragiforme]|uniref:uncharacterized protein n=1 Tax=Hypoxylon fragiforme TaxID=63214 RepID=UPI0020C6E93E|nr:uncharacterized protein GGS25DRAFT_288479 [Hypoxylon fragiforme]KAI2608723.1 hypothetical protein GGS25DRAFT_288479 [Hypoxylon fragiforme]
MLFNMGFFFTSLLLATTCAFSSCMAASTGYRSWKRENLENVALVDCTGVTNTSDFSSEASYFTGAPDDTPDDVAAVTSGQLRDWANATTPAYFISTGVTFKAVLGVRGSAGDLAGTATNGYGNFTCWQVNETYLYNHDDKNCYMVYDCNHQGALVLPTTSATASSNSTSAASSTSRSGLSVGGIIGVSVGVGCGALIIFGGAAVLLWRRRGSKKQQAAGADADANADNEKGFGDGSAPGNDPQLANPIWQGPGVRELETPEVYHELHSQYQPAEIHGEAVTGELDGSQTRVLELHSQDMPPRYDRESYAAAHGAYGGVPKGRA